MQQEAPKTTKARLAYFENWVDPIALEILSRHTGIDVSRLRYSDPVGPNLDRMKLAHGYQIAPRGELTAPWFADDELIEQCPQLLAVSSTGSGYDMIDVDACTRAGIIVCSQTGSNAISVAEHAVGLMLALIHKLAVADRALRTDPVASRFDYAGSDLNGKTVGLVGIGQIGMRVARLCNAFGMNVLAFDPHLSPDQISERGATPSVLFDLLGTSDIVSLHCPRTQETMKMFDRTLFERMKKGAFFVSTARGGIHVEEDLHAALASGYLGGAGLDVFLQEPPERSHPLVSLGNVIATPHSAGLSREAVRAMASFAADQWVDIFAGRVPPRIVNPSAWPRYRERYESIFGLAPEDIR